MGHLGRPLAWTLSLLLPVGLLSACAPAVRAGSLEPTLRMQDVAGGSIAMQNGIPVPTFEFEPRLRIDLDGTWRVERARVDDDLSLTSRDASSDRLVAEAAGRERPGFDDSGWDRLDVPGTLNAAPDTRQLGGWYRRSFDVPATWSNASVTLKFAAVNYVADVWLNGVHLGYHEGGYTPFAFDAAGSLLPGEPNLLAVRVDNPPWGTRNDIVPWGLTDWWNYGGITGSVWLEATPPIHAVRADVVPHLDGADVSVVLRHAAMIGPEPSATPAPSPTPTTSPSPQPVPASGSGEPSATAEPRPPTTMVTLEVLPARVTPQNVADPDVRRLVPGIAPPLAQAEIDAGDVAPDEPSVVEASFRFGGADQWSPAFPALYVLHVRVTSPDGRADDLWTTFGLRRISVDPDAPRLLLNGEPVMFHGVGLHDEVLTPAPREADVTGHRVHSAGTLLTQLEHARQVGADLIRAAHTPANPLLLMLADRLGFGIWEEIPLYHFTPLTFGVTMQRGIPQQMLREMALRDMNHPSVLFHGLANESTGQAERTDALRALRDIDRQIDGTRLTGQAAYGSEPADATQDPLDVAGFTFYYGVFYGESAAAGTERALQIAHATNPDKPILALEFGRWSDGRNGTTLQQGIFTDTYPAFERHADVRQDGFVGLATWWTLEDYLTMRPGITVEHFGLYAADGTARPAAASATAAFAARSGEGAELGIESDVRSARVDVPGGDDWRLAIELGYGLLVAFVLLAVILGLLLVGGGRSLGRRSS
ncbi:MAG TPA: glycoside hydrolase family 2 TIM barrel-domain containing protein [Candidatus Limnocylindria bacterium]|nr:glycoside hydrolase family 2 TIM barrel-domain containing protein [Candidatus Limnocylindria bacterium]